MSRIKEFNLPDLGEGLTEGEILKWLVAVGEVIELNQPIVEVETAKAAVEIPAKWAGRVRAIFCAEGDTVEVGTPIISIDTQPDAADEPEPAPEAAPAEGSAGNGRTAVLVGYGPRTGAAQRRPRRSTPTDGTSVSSGGTSVTGGGASVNGGAGAVPAQAAPAAGPATVTPQAFTPPPVPAQAVPATAAPAAVTAAGSSRPVLAKPPVRKLARDLGVDLTALTGSGPAGSITREDVQTAAQAAANATAESTAASGTAGVPGGAAAFGPDRERRIPVKGVRRLTAENMVASAFTAPHVTEFLTVDVTRSMKALKRLRKRPEWADVRVSPLLLVAKAVLLAVGRHPMVNSTWAGDEIVVKDYVNLGIAAATDRGLIVPNIKDAGRLSLAELAQALNDLVRTAKAGRTTPAEMTGGTLTITNVGVFGVDAGTPILPPGESAILAFGAVREMPWVHKGKVCPRQVTTLALSFDHRIIDGELGSKFLRDIGVFLTDPEAALLAWT